MQRRIKPVKLQENYYGTLFPKPAVHSVDMSTLDGGLNLWQLPYRLGRNQSPDLLNVYWMDGRLKSRPGQAYLYETPDPSVYGDFFGCYDRLWQGSVIAHKGTKLYKINPSTGVHDVLYTGLTATKGAGFFVFNNKLYYLGGGHYLEVTSSFVATDVQGYVPTVVMNMKPNGAGGTSYQGENRIAAGKTILYTSDGSSTDYYLPYKNIDSVDKVRVNVYDAGTQTYSWQTLTATTDYTVDLTNGIVSFDSAPAQEDPENPNNVEITISKADTAAANNILTSTCLSVYGGNTDLAVVVGGCSSQPNAYFWSGNTSRSVDPTYFPTDYYNLAGADASNKITAFGRQQGLLIIFQEHSIGKASFGDETINDRTYLTLNYTGINAAVGCDVPGSVQLCNNNLVFANTYGGVYLLANSTPADENNVRQLSKNVNGNGLRGLFVDLVKDKTTSFDDTERYWLITNGKVYVWDYRLRGYTADEENLSWFYFNNIHARGVYQNDKGEHFYFTADGSLVGFTPRVFNDFGEAIERRYAFAVQTFGTYEVLKDVLNIKFAIRSDTRSVFNVHYETDWEVRDDRTPIVATPRGITMLPYDLTDGYDFESTVFAGWATRIPRTFHIQHFGMTIYNNEVNTDIGLVSAQIFYRYVRDSRESRGFN